MRNYQLLDTATIEDNILKLSRKEEDGWNPIVAMAREGERISISVSLGALELALRLYFDEFARHMARLEKVPGLTTTRKVGSGNANIGLGLTEDGKLVMRPKLVGDATGHITFNLLISPEGYTRIREWLDAST